MISIPMSKSIPSIVNRFFDSSRQNNTKQALIRINSIDIEGANVSKVVAFIGSRKAFKSGFFHCDSPEEKVWNFKYTNKARASFVLALFSQGSMLENNRLLGEIEIKLSSFKSNSITKHNFILRSEARNMQQICVNLTIHLNENGSKPFDSPESGLLNYEYEIISKSMHHIASFEDLTV